MGMGSKRVRRWLFVALLVVGVFSSVRLLQSARPSQEAAPSASSKEIRPAMILYGAGIADGMITTITPASLGSRKTWRITDYSQDPASSKVNDYDLYDLDRETLAPLRSVMNTEEFHLELTFGDKEVIYRKTTQQDTITENIPLSTVVQPEGPGLEVFVAALPLAVGYKTQYAVVDRWGGHGNTRVKTVSLSVSKRAIEQTSSRQARHLLRLDRTRRWFFSDQGKSAGAKPTFCR
jgi:hypothetical protein